MLVKPSSIRLRHWGYLPQLKRAKLERSVRLLELELRDRPNQLYYQIELGRTLLALGRSAAAKSVLGGATAALLREAPSPHPPTSMAAALLEYLLAAPASESAAFIAESALLDLCQRWFPRSAPLLWAIARRAYAAGDFVHAAGALQKLIDLGRSDSYDKMISFDPRIIREDAVLNLAACHIRLARLDEAERLLRGLLVGPRAAEAEANLKAIGHLRGLAAE